MVTCDGYVLIRAARAAQELERQAAEAAAAEAAAAAAAEKEAADAVAAADGQAGTLMSISST